MRKSENSQRAFEAAKHIYDLSVMEKHPIIVALLSDDYKLKKLLDIRITEELERLDGIPGVHPTEFVFFTSAVSNSAVRSAYETMQRQYVLRDTDRIAFDNACGSLKRLQTKLLENKAWKNYEAIKPSVLAKLHNMTERQASEISDTSVQRKKIRDLER